MKQHEVTIVSNDLYICALCCQKQVSQAAISNCIPQNYLSLPQIPASGGKVIICASQDLSMLQYMITIFLPNAFTTGFNWGRVMHICINKLGHHWFREWVVVPLVPGHFLDQCGNIVNWSLRNKLKWNSYFSLKNAFENVIWKMAAILSQPQCVKQVRLVQANFNWFTYCLKLKTE